jgi:hypothetical protein
VSTKPGGDKVDADQREFKSKGGGERGQGRGGGGDNPEPVADAPAAGSDHEYQRATGSHLARRVARYC